MKTRISANGCMERPPDGLVTRLTQDTARRLGSATRTTQDGFGEIGKLITGSPGFFVRFSRAIGRRMRGGNGRPAKEELLLTREGIRSIITEELTRWPTVAGGTSLSDLEKRLRCMAETIEALQRRLNELSTHGLVSEADVWKEMNSLESAGSLTNDERALLVGVFRRNMALQKPKVASVGEGQRYRDGTDESNR